MKASEDLPTDRMTQLSSILQQYSDHAVAGQSLRAIARQRGTHPSTVMRRVRRIEQRRDDPLIDDVLQRLQADMPPRFPVHIHPAKEEPMTAQIRQDAAAMADRVERILAAPDCLRVLRRLAEAGAMLAVAPDLDKAAVLRELPGGGSVRTAVVDRELAGALVLQEWVALRRQGRIVTYAISASGRTALRHLAGGEESLPQGLAEAVVDFAARHRVWGERVVVEDDGPRRLRCNLAESPLALLGRRRDKDGVPFLTPEQVAAGERLREDFELAQMGAHVTQNWDRFLTGGTRGTARMGGGPAEGPRDARERVARALGELGPGLGDMALRCCCHLEGLETAERRLGWSARSGKIVLRIALDRLSLHYRSCYGAPSPLIG